MRTKPVALVVVAVVIALPVERVGAEPSLERQAIQRRSASVGFGSSQLPSMRRTVGEGAAIVARRIAAQLHVKLGTGASYSEKAEPNRSLLIGSDWTLEATDDGNFVRFRAKPSSFTLPASKKPSKETIEAAGRGFLQNVLADFVKLGTGEELVFLGTRYGHQSGQAPGASKPDADDIKEWMAIFGRKVGGELVVGGGSSVSVLFNADGTVQGFDRDWPTYVKTGLMLDVLPGASVRNRHEKIRPPSAASATSTEERFECGYFDPGGRSSGKLKSIQPACLRSILTVSANSARSGVIYAIPAARIPVSGDSWPELGATCTLESCQDEQGH